mmetsp:Transcript_18456/g.26037  ORF Transcript_18456/g.26037 Transcript_18456/m.26037 type:complete len:225 (+) Transcript_18456:84-758(+)
MPPRQCEVSTYDETESEVTMLEAAAIELEEMRSNCTNHGLHPLPPTCYRIITSLPGNQRCIDCGSNHPDWATVSYGALLCLKCSGRHRSLGVKTSCVRSISMDNWSHAQVLAMLEGGNTQLSKFFERHDLVPRDDINGTDHRYKTKAASFYREHLQLHVKKVSHSGMYQGREAFRSTKHSESRLTRESSSARRRRTHSTTRRRRRTSTRPTNAATHLQQTEVSA